MAAACISSLPFTGFDVHLDMAPPVLCRERAIGLDWESDPSSIPSRSFSSLDGESSDSIRFSHSGQRHMEMTMMPKSEDVSLEEKSITAFEALGVNIDFDKIKKNPSAYRGAMMWDFLAKSNSEYQREEEKRRSIRDTLTSLPDLVRLLEVVRPPLLLS